MTAALIPLFTIIVLGALAARSGYVPAATIAPQTATQAATNAGVA